MTTDALAAKQGRAKPPYRHPETGAVLPGVTTVLKVLDKGEGLLTWANNLGLQGIRLSEYRDDLAAVGRCAHALILEALSQGKRPCDRGMFTGDQITRAERSLLKFLAWRKAHRLVTWECERDVISLKHGVGGTPDWWGLLDDTLTVLDFKSGKAIYDEHLYQAAAYVHLIAEATGERPQAIRILQVGRDESEGFSERTIDDPAELDRLWSIFLHALAIYRLKEAKPTRTRARAAAPVAPAASGRIRSMPEGRQAIADLFGSRG